MDKKNIIIPLNEQSESMLRNIIKKHGLEENREEAIRRIKEHAHLNEAVVIKLTRDLILGEVSNDEFLDSLEQKLKTSRQEIKNLSVDIVDNLVPLLKKFTEEELQDYLVNEEGFGSSTEKLILEKLEKKNEESAFIKARQEKEMSASVNLPYTKKVEVKSVEENAELIKKARTVIPQQDEPKSQEPDPYKETLE